MYRLWKILKKIGFLIYKLKRTIKFRKKAKNKTSRKKLINYNNQKIVISITLISSLVLVSSIIITLLTFSEQSRVKIKEAQQYIMVKNHTLQDLDNLSIYVEIKQNPEIKRYIKKDVNISAMKDKLLNDISFPKITGDGSLKLDYTDKKNNVKTLYIIDQFSIDYLYNIELTIAKYDYETGTFTFTFKQLE